MHAYSVRGGQVVLLLSSDQAQLVSATPAPGCSVMSWSGPGWLRVDFAGGTSTVSSVFASWNGTPPGVRTVDY